MNKKNNNVIIIKKIHYSDVFTLHDAIFIDKYFNSEVGNSYHNIKQIVLKRLHQDGFPYVAKVKNIKKLKNKNAIKYLNNIFESSDIPVYVRDDMVWVVNEWSDYMTHNYIRVRDMWQVHKICGLSEDSNDLVFLISLTFYDKQ